MNQLTAADWTAGCEEVVDRRATALCSRTDLTYSHGTEDLPALQTRTVRTLVHQPALPHTVHVRLVRTVFERCA